jgi:Zn-dependent metalloprotease
LFSKNFKSELGLTVDENLTEKRREKDNTGRLHIFYQHYLNGIEVEGSELITHSTNDAQFTEVVNDKLIKAINKQTNKISGDIAIKTALLIFKSQKYAWQDSLLEIEIKEETQNPKASNYPEPKLLYAKQKVQPQKNINFKLCYRFIISSVEPIFKKAVYIDAESGKLFKEVDMIISCNNPATATTRYNGNQQIITDWKGWPWNRFILIDCNNRNIHTKYGFDLNPEAANTTTTWGTNEQNATSAHWAAEMTWDLFRNVYSRNGTNNGNREVKTLVNFSGLIDNAGYDYSGGGNDKIRVGVTSVGNRTLATLDIMGHEITHGLTYATARLVYENESGALNESFSDIFGFMVERRTQPANFDWLMGEDAFFDNPNFIRNLQNPNLSGFVQPITYLGINWATGPADNGGVHTNSGVQNRWFFLLSNGGFQNGVAVNGIGIDDAARISFNSLTVYLGQNSNFNDARNGSINAAIALFGLCSNQVRQVTNAWAAVGVGLPANPNCITLNPSGLEICYDVNPTSSFPFTITPSITPANGVVTWDIPAGYTFTTAGNSVTITDGILQPDIYDYFGATLTSNQGNPVTAWFRYATRECNFPGYLNHPFNGRNTELKPKIEKDFFTYPSPAKSEINITVIEDGLIKLIDLEGRVIIRQRVKAGNNKVNITSFKAGMYLIQMTNSHKTVSKKIILAQ